ncbi:TRAM protein [Perilla frutescens var. hirtella]|uniref:TRAM protein n=1 Tax=Perilla frutescens var. hirtella TaxID=608512 RepID=A0AAD4JPU2_PERFH|nr:TRAM protein [Perilla frutescens var. frutescens]KAH6837381.1 TRAM protein [Perilla frutescens var. hirtella]
MIEGEYAVMQSAERSNMLVKSYLNQAELLLKDYVSADLFVVYTSIFFGVFACKTVYDLSQLISPVYFKSYPILTKALQIEWSNRAMSTFHAIYIATVSLYLVLWSDLFSDDPRRGPITLRSSTISISALGVSVGYFLSDLSMIIWRYPSLGGMEYVFHHLISLMSVAYAMLTGEAQIYTYMVLISEATTPSINLRWYLDAAGMKRSKVYTINGVAIFLAWLVARILLFIYLFWHSYLHYDQVKQMHEIGVVMMFVIPSVLSVMNLIWFSKIFKGMVKTLKRE